MAGLAQHKPKHYTVAQANASLPLIRAIAADMVRVAREIQQRRERLDMVVASRRGASRDGYYREEIEHAQSELEEDTRHLDEYVEEITELGAIARDAVEGLVDFPAFFQGRPIYLSWKLGEPRVAYWHETDDAPSVRRPLTDEMSDSGELADAWDEP